MIREQGCDSVTCHAKIRIQTINIMIIFAPSAAKYEGFSEWTECYTRNRLRREIFAAETAKRVSWVRCWERKTSRTKYQRNFLKTDKLGLTWKISSSQ
jgi:hypothetical protein